MSHDKCVRLSLCTVTLLLISLPVTVAHASVVGVGTCMNNANYPTITEAVAHVPAGSTIKICPGNYFEQFTISKNLTLEGIASGNQNAVVIFPPPGGLTQNTTDPRGSVAAQILVQGTAGPVNISNLTVDGTGNNFTSGDIRGILYQDASGTVNHVTTQNQIPGGTLNGDQSGQGIMVETVSSASAALTVENSSVSNYNKNGIVARYAGAKLIATGNYVEGAGPVSGNAAQNGIELAFDGATGTIKNNTVINNVYAGDPTTATSAGILLYDTGEDTSIVVSGNIVGNSQEGIQLFTDTPGTSGDGVTVTGNKIFGTSFGDAIDVCTSSNIITGNTIFNTAESGVHLDASCGAGVNNHATTNTIVGSACAGYLIDAGASDNAAPSGTFQAVPFEVATTTSSCTIPPDVRARVRVGTGSRAKP
jgi:hypothetical protein